MLFLAYQLMEKEALAATYLQLCMYPACRLRCDLLSEYMLVWFLVDHFRASN